MLGISMQLSCSICSYTHPRQISSPIPLCPLLDPPWGPTIPILETRPALTSLPSLQPCHLCLFLIGTPPSHLPRSAHISMPEVCLKYCHAGLSALRWPPLHSTKFSAPILLSRPLCPHHLYQFPVLLDLSASCRAPLSLHLFHCICLHLGASVQSLPLSRPWPAPASPARSSLGPCTWLPRLPEDVQLRVGTGGSFVLRPHSCLVDSDDVALDTCIPPQKAICIFPRG